MITLRPATTKKKEATMGPFSSSSIYCSPSLSVARWCTYFYGARGMFSNAPSEESALILGHLLSEVIQDKQIERRQCPQSLTAAGRDKFDRQMKLRCLLRLLFQGSMISQFSDLIASALGRRSQIHGRRVDIECGSIIALSLIAIVNRR